MVINSTHGFDEHVIVGVVIKACDIGGSGSGGNSVHLVGVGTGAVSNDEIVLSAVYQVPTDSGTIVGNIAYGDIVGSAAR